MDPPKSLEQLTDIRELLQEAKQKLAALDVMSFSPPALGALGLVIGFVDIAIAAVVRVEQLESEGSSD